MALMDPHPMEPKRPSHSGQSISAWGSFILRESSLILEATFIISFRISGSNCSPKISPILRTLIVPVRRGAVLSCTCGVRPLVRVAAPHELPRTRPLR